MPRTVVSLLLAVAACLHMVAGTHAAGPRAIQLSVDQMGSDWYQREFGISVPRPAIFNDERAVDCRGDGHLTSTAYFRTGSTTADLLVLYFTRDGLNLIINVDPARSQGGRTSPLPWRSIYVGN